MVFWRRIDSWGVRRVCTKNQEARFSTAAIIAVAKSRLLFFCGNLLILLRAFCSAFYAGGQAIQRFIAFNYVGDSIGWSGLLLGTAMRMEGYERVSATSDSCRGGLH